MALARLPMAAVQVCQGCTEQKGLQCVYQMAAPAFVSSIHPHEEDGIIDTSARFNAEAGKTGVLLIPHPESAHGWSNYDKKSGQKILRFKSLSGAVKRMALFGLTETGGYEDRGAGTVFLPWPVPENRTPLRGSGKRQARVAPPIPMPPSGNSSSIAEAVAYINRYKQQHGSNVVLSITDRGLLKVLMEIGG